MLLSSDLVSKLNECANANFVAARNVCFGRQSWFSVLVIIGLLLEAPELVHDMFSIARKRVPRFTCRFILIKSYLEWAKILAFGGWILIIVGLLGELRTASRIVDLSASIQECSDAKVRAATIEASQSRAWVLHLKPRYANFNHKEFVDRLKNVPAEKAEILYDGNDEEAYTFASAIALALGPGNGNAGWIVSGPRPVVEEDALPDLFRHPKDVPLIMRAGGQGGCGIIAKSIPSALREALASTGVLSQINGYQEPKMPVGVVRIVIGKQWN